MPRLPIDQDPEYNAPLGDAWGPFSFGKLWDDGRAPELSDWRGRGDWMISVGPEMDKTVSGYRDHVESVKQSYLRPNFYVELYQQSLKAWLPVFDALKPCPTVMTFEECTDVCDREVLEALCNSLEVCLESCAGLGPTEFKTIGEVSPRWTRMEFQHMVLPNHDCLLHLAALPKLSEVDFIHVTIGGDDLKEFIDRMGDRLQSIRLFTTEVLGVNRGELWKLSPKIRFDAIQDTDPHNVPDIR